MSLSRMTSFSTRATMRSMTSCAGSGAGGGQDQYRHQQQCEDSSEDERAASQNVDPRLKKIWKPGSRVALKPFWPSRHDASPVGQMGATNCGRLIGNPRSMRIGPTGVEYRKPMPTVWEK